MQDGWLARDYLLSPEQSHSQYPHTQLGTAKGSKGDYPQAREFGYNGQVVKDIDFTDHGSPDIHPFPHQHLYKPNDTGGTLIRDKAQPFKISDVKIKEQ